MGGSYPTNTASGWGSPVPMPDFPTRVSWPDRDPYTGRPKTVRVPKFPWRPPGVFPNGWRPPKTTFGRLPPTVVSNPLRFPTRLPWGWAGVAILPLMWAMPSVRISSMAGWSVCWDYGGPQQLRSGPVRASCPGDGYRLLSGQVPSGKATDVVTITSPNLAQAIWFGPAVNPEASRMQYRKMIARPDIPSSHPNYPYPITTVRQVPAIAITPDIWASPDPNVWPPFNPVPVFPIPRPWPGWTPKTYPRTVSGPVTEPVPVFEPVPDVVITPTGVFPTGPHVRTKPDTKTREGKYAAKGPYGLLAAQLLRLAAGTFGGITEVVDLVKAIYAALPAELIAQQPDNLAKKDLLPHMLGLIAKHYKSIDLGEAVENIAVNQVEDWAWGKYFKAVDKVSRTGTYYQGFDRELSNLNDLFREVYQ